MDRESAEYTGMMTSIIESVEVYLARLIPKEACSSVFAFSLEDIDVHVLLCFV